ncbi:hypothetical protein TrLO_g7559 [Triparma laevis f. longispina]|uniref:Phospholipase/carboxylesterase/thioesterase domain-containing protein n=1 Tax=Triparma laevis f. longispina TaxID=1714387 RepID=A0A9W6ZWL4_9STRA|nr:hypothetical protein TrLO_g7559 [Triparma laevis f. longispina]
MGRLVRVVIFASLLLQATKSYVPRRSVLNFLAPTALISSVDASSKFGGIIGNLLSKFDVIVDPSSYAGLAYLPPNIDKPPLLVVLHGSGKNDLPLSNLANINGEHSGLPPSLISSGFAPRELTDNFAVVAPYSEKKTSFYDDPRSRLLSFIDYAQQILDTDPSNTFLLGFSDGATVALELSTTQRFRAAVLCSSGFSGALPPAALDLLKTTSFLVFHSADDVIFPPTNSDRLVNSLRSVGDPSRVKYTRFDQDPESLPARVRGHSTGITASKTPSTYKWLLSKTKTT